MENYPIGKVIKHISLLIEKNLNKMLVEKDLSASQGFILSFLSRREDKITTTKDIEKEFDIAQSTAFGVIKRLEKKGFVTTSVDESRSTQVFITKTGLELSEYIRECIIATEEMVLSSLTDTEQLIFKEILKKIEGELL